MKSGLVDNGLLSRRTADGLKFDLARLRARQRRHRREAWPEFLHLGASLRQVSGWLNADVAGSDCDVDLASRRPLPWPDSSFSAIVSQHVIEHLEMEELARLLAELRRVIREDGEMWLSCPDMEKVCRAYVDDKGATLCATRVARWPEGAPAAGTPPQQIVNLIFHQWGQHRNLYDFELLTWMLRNAGFGLCDRTEESAFLHRFPGFPARNDDDHSLYVITRP